MRARLGDSVSGRYRLVENSLLTKHVVAAGNFAKDAGSTPAASTTSFKAQRQTKTVMLCPSSGESGRLLRSNERSELLLSGCWQ